ncbi:hypothetical protein KOW79_001783 [Hemibagrus wyckioides]|uniref:Small integral membrane protein 22 n=1 Tax=Hemibagrus wyckioides TaxID=337641 RepID=A0A9D3P609_9TELE|nr:small integral membrane protein 22 [Hemibagrus wyckioides]KAG7335187.1 hypothetical protein KOW79_001783 [Hemibagrus wyckioides]
MPLDVRTWCACVKETKVRRLRQVSCDRCIPEAIEKKVNKISQIPATMSQDNLQQEFQNQVNDVFTRLQNKQMFQSDWDIASFAIFFIFIGMVLLLIILVLIRCCCCCCLCDEKPKRHKVGIDNMALEP